MSGKIAGFASFLSEDSAAVSALFATTNIATARQIPAAQITFSLYAFCGERRS
jgi:hypothetical protein